MVFVKQLPLAPRMGERLLDELLTALAAQAVTIPGTAASGRVLAGVARSLSAALTERRALVRELEDRLDAHPLGEVLTSMPGVGVRTAVKILTIVGDGTAFPTSAHLASYAGLAPVTRRSGSSIRGETRSQRGHRALKSALFLSAFASLSDPASRAYYDRKRKEGKRHNAAFVCLARRRLDVLHAMLRTKTPYIRGGPKTNQEQPDRESHAQGAGTIRARRRRPAARSASGVVMRGQRGQQCEDGRVADPRPQDPLQRWAHAQQQVAGAAAEPGGLRRQVVVVTGQHAELGERLVVGAHQPQRVRQGPGGVGDDVSVAGVGLALAGVRVGEPAHRQAGQVSDLQAQLPGHGDRQRPDARRLVDDQQYLPAAAQQSLEHPAQRRLVVDDDLIDQPPAVHVERAQVMVTLADVEPREHRRPLWW